MSVRRSQGCKLGLEGEVKEERDKVGIRGYKGV
jgi:hypothetical protein